MDQGDYVMQIANIKQFTREYKSLIIIQDLFRYMYSVQAMWKVHCSAEIVTTATSETMLRSGAASRGANFWIRK